MQPHHRSQEVKKKEKKKTTWQQPTADPRAKNKRKKLGPWPYFPQFFMVACGQPGECIGEELPVQDLLQIAPSQLDSPVQFSSLPQACFKPESPG